MINNQREQQMSKARAAIDKLLKKLELCDDGLAANGGNKEHELVKTDIDFADSEQIRARAAKIASMKKMLRLRRLIERRQRKFRARVRR